MMLVQQEALQAMVVVVVVQISPGLQQGERTALLPGHGLTFSRSRPIWLPGGPFFLTAWGVYGAAFVVTELFFLVGWTSWWVRVVVLCGDVGVGERTCAFRYLFS